MQKSFQTGQLVKVKGQCGKFRYISKNIVKNLKTGQVRSVKMANMREPFDFETLIVRIGLFAAFVVFPIWVIYLLIFY
jgi:hypothetical protein